MPFEKTVSLSAFAILALSAPSLALAQPADDRSQEGAIEASLDAVTPDADTGTSINLNSLDLARKIVDLGYPEGTREALFFGSMDQTIAQMRSSMGEFMPSDDPVAVKIFDDWIAKYTAESKVILRKHIPSIMDGMTRAYAQLFTEQELRDILAFVETPSGKQFFDLMPDVIGSDSFAKANQAYFDESMRLMIPAQRDLLRQLKDHQKRIADPAETT